VKVANLKNPVMFSWLLEEGARLDAPPFLSDALEARFLLKRLALPKENLSALTCGHDGGIFNGPMFSRPYVEDPEHGVPFLGSSDMLQADLSNIPLLSKKAALSSRLQFLRLEEGMTLISCSGTIGRTIYVRPDMAGIWSSQHIMKIVPNRKLVRPGYLYAFLSSKFGNAQISGGTYGAIIQHIEARHIADLQVPRLPDSVEEGVHRLVVGAAGARTKASALLRTAQNLLFQRLGMRRALDDHEYRSPHLGTCNPCKFRSRGDAFYYSPINVDARSVFDSAASSKRLSDVAEVYIPNIFKRLYADDPRYGYPYITGAEVFELEPRSSKYLLRQVAESNLLILRTGMIVVQEAGQLGGLIGRSVLVGGYLDGFACTNNMVRIVPNDASDAGYLLAVLSSEYGRRLLAREGAGSSIPHLDSSRVAGIPIPWAARRIRNEIGDAVTKAVRLRDTANAHEAEARNRVETALAEVV
jgi:type I restriction enzyme S subunit